MQGSPGVTDGFDFKKMRQAGRLSQGEQGMVNG